MRGARKGAEEEGWEEEAPSAPSSVFRLSWEAIFAREIARPLLSASPSLLSRSAFPSFSHSDNSFLTRELSSAAANALVNFHDRRDSRSPVPHLLLRRTRRGEGCELQFTYEDLRPWWL